VHRNRNFMLLWAAQWISAAGDTFSFLALAIRVDSFFTDAGDSARALGMVLIAYALPVLLFGIFAGTLVDRWDRKRVMIASDVIRALLAPAFLLVRTTADLPLAFAAAFLLSSFSVFFYPARTALLPNIVKEDDLMSANGWMQVGQTIARLSGPILAGIVVGRWGTNTAFWIDAVSYMVSAVLVLGIVGAVTRAKAEEDTKQPAWKDLAEGVRYALGSRLLQGITLGLGVAMLGIGAVNVLFVPFLRHTFGVSPEALGGVQTAQGVGMLLGGLLMGGLGKRLPPRLVSVASMVMLGVGIGLFGVSPVYAMTLVIMPFVGFTLPPLNAALSTMLQRGVPKEMLGRAGSVTDMAISLTNLISMGAAGWLGDLLGLRETFMLGGLLCLIGGLAMGWMLRGHEAGAVRPAKETLGQHEVAPGTLGE
jgi:DHA3 family macrolide efflux protein-like MFS transporter